MEDLLQLVARCFPIATFVLLVSSCTSKGTKIEDRGRPGKQLTLSSISSVSVEAEPEILPEPVETIGEQEEPLEERQAASGNPKEKSEDGQEPVKKKEENKMEQEVVLDESNSHFAFLLAVDEKTDKVQVLQHGRCALEQTAAFQWTMKKRLSYDEGCWKHLSRRISAIKAEGFDVRVNTRKARENKMNADRETLLDKVFQKMAAGKPKKKGGD